MKPMKTFTAIALALCVACAGMFGACSGQDGGSGSGGQNGGQNGGGSSLPETALYGSISYFETLSGAYEKNSLYTHEKSGKVGDTVTYTPEEVAGFTFDEDNENNVLSATISADGTTTLVAYYSRNEYDITVAGGSSSQGRAKYGATVQLTPSLAASNLSWQVEGEGAQLEGNNLTVGTSDVQVRAVYGGGTLIDGDTYFRATDSAAKTAITVADPEKESGIVFLYNTEMTQNTATAAVRYYSFVASSEGARLLYTENTTVTELGQADVTDYAAGEHTFEIAVSESGTVDCKLDDETVITEVTPTTAIDFGGQMGIYSLEDNISFSALTPLKGEMETAELRAYALRMMTTLEAEVYRFNAATSQVVSDSSVIDAATVESLQEDVQSTQELLNGMTTSRAIVAEMNAHGNALRYRLYKELVWKSLTGVASSMHESLLLPFVEDCPDTTQNADNVAIHKDLFAPDVRWYVPNAYMLYSGLQDASSFGPYSLGLLDYLRRELDSATTTTELAAINARYIEDVVRATVWHDCEFYYWSMYAKHGAGNVTSVWGFLYNYMGGGGANFAYAGCIQGGYIWTGDYRLFDKWFNPASKEGAVHNMNQIIADFNWMRDHQIVVKQGG